MSEETGSGNSGGQGQGSPDISSPPDPTQAMPPFDSGKAVESMSPEDAAKEWREMTLDSDGKYKNFPRSVFLARRDKLFKHGFSEKIEQDRKAQEAKSKEFLEKENERIQDRDEREEIGKARSALVQHFGGEKEADAAIKSAKSIFKRFATPSDISFVEKSGLGNDPEFIQKLAEIDQIFKRGAYKRR